MCTAVLNKYRCSYDDLYAYHSYRDALLENEKTKNAWAFQVRERHISKGLGVNTCHSSYH